MVKKFNVDFYIKHLKNPNKTQLQKQIKEEITDTDLLRYFGQKDFKNIIKYSDLANYNSIQQLLPRNKSWKIILIENQVNSGHWTLLLRYKNTIEYFNSYGTFPSQELDFISSLQNDFLNQDIKHLNLLLTQALPHFKIIYNKKRLQKLENGVNTCGKWCILRIMMMEKYNMDLKQFHNFINKLSKQYKLTSDELVTLIIQK
jgi:hypothetical protein